MYYVSPFFRHCVRLINNPLKPIWSGTLVTRSSKAVSDSVRIRRISSLLSSSVSFGSSCTKVRTFVAFPRDSFPSLKTMKLPLEKLEEFQTPELKLLISLFSKYGYALRIAGGAVRDILMGKLPHDIDFATTATPTQMKEMFEQEGIRMLNKKGEKHGTITCRINDKENFEVTTLRIDVSTDGRHAEVEFTTDWQLDAFRRDLTINAMFLDFDGTVYDYFNGQKDLEERKIRFVGTAEARIQEDYLRILRYFRFFGRISTSPDEHDKETLKVIRDNVHGLAGISGERLLMEFRKIITGRFAPAVMRVMLELGVGQYLGLPTLCNVAELEKVYDRCHHLSPLPMTLVTALLQHEHEVHKLRDRLRISNDEVQLSLFLLANRNVNSNSDLLKHCKSMLCDAIGKDPKTRERICELIKYLGNEAVLNEFVDYKLPTFPLNGFKLLERGVPKGPVLAKTLDALRLVWKENNFNMTEDELLRYMDDNLKKPPSPKK